MMRVALLALFALPGVAAAADNPDFEAAKKAWDNYEIDRVLPLLDEAMAVSTDRVEKTQILELRAHVQISMEQRDAARATFVELLTLSPDYQIPEGSSPKIRAAFEAARKSLPPPPPPEEDEVDLRPVEPAPAGAPVWKTWWFWTIVGGVVVAGGTALTIVLASPREPEADFVFRMSP